MKLELTDTGESPVLDTYMQGYEKVFTLPDESEDRDGFAACLALNHGEQHKRLSAEYGEFREFVGVAHDPDKGVVGGANFIAGPVELEDGSKVVTVHLNYAHIDEEHRRGGRLHELVDQVTKTSETAFSDKPVPVIVFLEQNDPLAMSREDYRRDTEASGIDQVDRMHAWSRLGAKIVDFPYVQPELAPGEEPNDTLALAAITKGVDSIPPEVLKGHLHRFFGVSVAKGEGLAESAVDQMDRLDGMIGRKESVALIDPAPAVAHLRTLDRDRLPEGSVRDYARGFANDNQVGRGSDRAVGVERVRTETLVESRRSTSEEIMSFVEHNPQLKPKTHTASQEAETVGREDPARTGFMAKLMAGVERVSPGAAEQLRGRWEKAIEGKVAKFEPSKAAKDRAALEADASIEGRFASEVARRYAGRPLNEIAKVLPEIWREGHMPKDKDAAFVEIANAARGVADRHMRGPDQGLSPADAREAKARALGTTLAFDSYRGSANQRPALPFSQRLETDGRTQIQEMRRELNPELGPKPMRPESGAQADRAMVPPSKGAVVAMHAARAAGNAR